MTSVEIKWDVSFERMKRNVEAFGIILKRWRVGTYFTNNVPFFFSISQLLPNSERHLSDSSMSLSQANFLKNYYSFVTVSRTFFIFQDISHTDHNSSLPGDVFRLFLWAALSGAAHSAVTSSAACARGRSLWAPNWCTRAQQRSQFHDTVGRMLLLPCGWLSSTSTKDVFLRPQNSQSFEEV